MSPEQALVGPGWRLSLEEERTLKEVEDYIDGVLAQTSGGKAEIPTGGEIPFPAKRFPLGALTLGTQITLIRRYREAGWGRVGIDTAWGHYTLTLYRAGL